MSVKREILLNEREDLRYELELLQESDSRLKEIKSIREFDALPEEDKKLRGKPNTPSTDRMDIISKRLDALELDLIEDPIERVEAEVEREQGRKNE